MDWVSGSILVFMMLLTVADVILRYLGKPILGAYELVSLSGLVVVGFAMPSTSWQRVHVNVDIFLGDAHRVRTLVLHIITRIIGILFFLVAGFYLMDMGNTLTKTHESTLTLVIPLYPFAYVLGVCCLAECLVLVSHILEAVTKETAHE